jgi:hypothetical protein
MKIAKLSDNELQIMQSYVRDLDEARRALKVAQDRFKLVQEQIGEYNGVLQRTHQIYCFKLADDGQNLIGYSEREWNANTNTVRG